MMSKDEFTMNVSGDVKVNLNERLIPKKNRDRINRAFYYLNDAVTAALPELMQQPLQGVQVTFYAENGNHWSISLDKE